jgi:hypothetical protein
MEYGRLSEKIKFFSAYKYASLRRGNEEKVPKENSRVKETC